MLLPMTTDGSVVPLAQGFRGDVASILAEYREMPCLTLTLPQAARFFNLEQARCERALVWLVGVGVLSTNGRTYASADIGRHRL